MLTSQIMSAPVFISSREETVRLIQKAYSLYEYLISLYETQETSLDRLIAHQISLMMLQAMV
jgi:hypothetical protein